MSNTPSINVSQKGNALKIIFGVLLLVSCLFSTMDMLRPRDRGKNRGKMEESIPIAESVTPSPPSPPSLVDASIRVYEGCNLDGTILKSTSLEQAESGTSGTIYVTDDEEIGSIMIQNMNVTGMYSVGGNNKNFTMSNDNNSIQKLCDGETKAKNLNITWTVK